MNTYLIKALPDDMIKAFCNTLLHSLWQGLILAAVAGLIMMCTRKSTATRRYNLLVAALLVFTLATVFTFCTELYHSKSIAQQFAQTNLAVANAPDHLPSVKTGEPVPVTHQLLNYVNTHADLVVLIWFLVVCARSVQLLTGLHGLRHLKRTSVFAVDVIWEQRIALLGDKLGIKRAVRIAESGLAKVPMVIGHLKPLILIPVGLITALPPAEIDAILIHELAHIRRRDYLANLLQSLVEIVFFFNPAVLWISSLIKAERENCCDDIAVAQTSSKVNYIKALVSCQEYNMASPAYAVAFAGNKGSLVGRVKRMVSNSNQSLNLMEKSLLTICLLTAGILTTAFSNADKINKLMKSTTKAVARVSHVINQQSVTKSVNDQQNIVTKPASEPAQNTTDTLIARKPKIYTADVLGDEDHLQISNGKSTVYLFLDAKVFYQVNVVDGKVVSMQQDGRTVSESEMPHFQPLINNALGKQDALNNRVRANVHIVAPVAAVSTVTAKVKDSVKVNVKVSTKQTTTTTTLGKLDAPLGKITQKTSVTLDSVYSQSAKPVKPYPGAYTTTYKPYTKDYGKNAHDRLMEEMKQDGLISGAKDANVSFKLSNKEFILNGKKQPDEIFQKYREEYVKATGQNEWTWYYNYDTNTKVN